MSSRLAVAAALTPFLSATPQLTAQPSAGTRADVQAFVKKYVEAMNATDVSTVMDMVSKRAEVSSVNDGDITRGWEAMRNDADETVGAEGSYRISVGSIDVIPLSGSGAIAVAPYTITVATQQGPAQVRGALTLVLQREAGQWKVVHEHYSTKPATQ